MPKEEVWPLSSSYGEPLKALKQRHGCGQIHPSSFPSRALGGRWAERRPKANRGVVKSFIAIFMGSFYSKGNNRRLSHGAHNGACGLIWWLLVTRTNGESVAVMSKKQAVGERHNINLRIAQLSAAQGPSQSCSVLMQSGGSHLASVLVNQRHTTSLAGLEA